MPCISVALGSVISSSLPNDLACIVTFLATTQAGYVCAPLNPTYTESENEWYDRRTSSTSHSMACYMRMDGLPVSRHADGRVTYTCIISRYLKDARSAIWIIPHGTSKKHLALAQKHHILLCEITFDHKSAQFTLVPIQPVSHGHHAVAPVITPTPSTVALLLHTSGTTSAPKAVPLTHANLCRTVVNIKNTYDIKVRGMRWAWSMYAWDADGINAHAM